jgi:ribosomal protein S6--L-glutamate ligase
MRSPAVHHGGPRVGVLVEARYLRQRQPNGLCRALRDRGARVELVDPEDGAFPADDNSWLAGLDVVVARGRSHGVLHLLGWAELAGVPTVNRRAAVEAVRDKAALALALHAGGVPTPPTWFGTVAHLARRVPARHFPLVLKPVFGDNGHGLRVVPTPAELADLAWPEPFALAQRLLPTDGRDLKVYGAGDRVWAVRVPSPLLGTGDEAEPVPANPDLVALARHCRARFGLDLYGLDCLETPEGPVVVEVNEFPNYTAVEEADVALAGHVLARAGR